MTEFSERLFALVDQIPEGSFTTYKHLAMALKSSPRAVGQALRRNKEPIKRPCHRVIATDYSLGGYCGKLRSDAKVRLLEKEGLTVVDFKVTSIDKLHTFS